MLAASVGYSTYMPLPKYYSVLKYSALAQVDATCLKLIGTGVANFLHKRKHDGIYLFKYTYVYIKRIKLRGQNLAGHNSTFSEHFYQIIPKNI